MAAPIKFLKTRTEIEKNFRHVFQGLQLSCKAYDEGYMGEASRLAAAVFILVHDYGRSQVSLLKQLDRKEGAKFLNSARPLNTENLVSEMPLVLMRFGQDENIYQPILGQGPFTKDMSYISYLDWWEMAVLRDMDHRKFTRKNIVFHLRHGEGGGHVSPSVDEDFVEITRNNSIGLTFGYNGKTFVPEYAPHYASMRQIAWEIEQTITKECGDILNAQ